MVTDMDPCVRQTLHPMEECYDIDFSHYMKHHAMATKSYNAWLRMKGPHKRHVCIHICMCIETAEVNETCLELYTDLIIIAPLVTY